MQEFNLDDLELETGFDEDSDAESQEALEDFFKTMGIRNAKDVPALKESSQKAKNILKRYCSSGNHHNRLNKVIDFYKCLDWLPFKEMDHSLLTKFNEEDRQVLLREIKIYLNRREEKLSRTHEWREEHKQRVWNYYKERVPSRIKIELEDLRDYELNLIGHDRNWQYYFSFKSFKKIDEFLNMSLQTRRDIYENFKMDVYSYKANRDHNLSGLDTAFQPGKNWDDDIIKSINWEYSNKNRYKQTQNPLPQPSNDYTILGVPYGADVATIKQQYRKLAKIHHPDTPGGDECRMKEIVGAYSRLLKK